MKTLRQSFISLFSGPSLAVAVGCVLTLLVFDVLWCLQTTFRAMSVGALWPDTVIASLLLMLPWLLSRRGWLQYVVMLVLDGLLIANLMYCRTYFTAIPIGSYGLAGNLRDFLPSVADSFSPLFLALPLITLGTWLWARCTPSTPRSWKWLPAWGVSVVTAAVAAWCMMLPKGGFMRSYTEMKEACYYSTCTTPVYTLVGDYIWQVCNSSDTISAADQAFVDQWVANQRKLYAPAALPDSVPVRDNIVVIVCESLESWPLLTEAETSTPGTKVEITPYLNTLIADSTTLYAPEVVTQVGSGRSIDFQLLFNAGMLPMEGGVWSMSRPDNTYPTINRALAARNGARSYILSPDSPTTWNQALVARSFSIDTLLSRDSWDIDELVGKPAKLSDGSFLRQVSEHMASGDIWPQGTNAFIKVITYSGHNPFRLPDALKTVEFSKKYPERLRDYMETAHYTDSSLRTLVDYLRSRPDYARTLIVITGDHEGLGSSRPELHRAAPFVSDSPFTPLIVLNSPVAGRVDYPVGQTDIYPTMLQFLGLTDYEWPGMGVSIIDPRHPRHATVTMTGQLIGDGSPGRHEMSARRVSDLIIRHNRKTAL